MDLKLINNNSLQLRNFVFVDYIESSGIPEINLGINCSYTNLIKVECVLDVIEGNSGNYIYGCFSDTNILNYVYGLRLTSDSLDSFQILSNNGNRLYYIDVSFSGKTEIIQTPTYAKVNETDYTYTYRDKQSAYTNIPFVLLGKRNMGINVPSKVRIYSFKLYIDNELVRNLVPVVSYEQGHLEESCLYDTINNRFYYSSSTGSFTPSTNLNIFNKITTAFIKGCPNISGIDVLRECPNLERVRCNIGTVTGHLSEIYKYSLLSGFNDNYEKQNKARIIGTFNIDDYYSDLEVTAIRNRLDGTTVNTPQEDTYNINYLLENDLLAVQTLDSTKPNYNPAVAIILNNNNIGYTLDEPLNSNGGRYILTKQQAQEITHLSTIFRNKTTVEDSRKIVTDSNNLASYTFETFDELCYFTGITGWAPGLQLGTFQGCTSLRKVTIPTDLGGAQYTFNGCTALEEIKFLSSGSYGSAYRYTNCSNLIKVSVPSLDAWLSQNLGAYNTNTQKNGPFDVSNNGHLYIGDDELTQLVIPSEYTTIYGNFRYLRSLESISISDTVTSIADNAFKYTGLNATYDPSYWVSIPSSVGNLGYSAFSIVNFNIVDWYTGTRNLNSFQTTNNATVDTLSKPTTYIFHGNLERTGNSTEIRTKEVFIYGNYTNSASYMFSKSPLTEVIVIKGDYTNNHINSGELNYTYNLQSNFKFFEVMGNCTGRVFLNNRGNNTFSPDGTIIHLGYNGVITSSVDNIAPPVHRAKVIKIYVGDGSSQQHDQNILDAYLATNGWSDSDIASKLDLWYNYSGQYKSFKINLSLTGCSISDMSPHHPYILNGNSYHCKLTGSSGYVISSVTITMGGSDITDTYDSSTGEINIPSVTGNVVITASAS